MIKKLDSVGTKIKNLLADHLGLEPDDIEEEDSLVDDLHMQPSDLSDFIESLNSTGIDASNLDLTKMETIADLIEQITSGEYLE